MKNIKGLFHFMLTIASVLGFLGGWATLAHSRKPGQANTSTDTTSGGPVVQPLPTLQPIAPINVTGASNDAGTSIMSIITPPQQQQVPQQVPFQRQRPVFNSSGS